MEIDTSKTVQSYESSRVDIGRGFEETDIWTEELLF